ncbi:hypothetical protein DPMN_059444 [Dreissena polymorpha]|uniref:Uncharacterized protein n=1 Tax=Dreissena polymorpha TaxID=45954 RepID=A0A9D4C3Z8_DREPO|nr:hypothetical protein DPMN_059444 [Dreissena polymorpha]
MPRPWWPCFKATKTIFELIQDIMGQIFRPPALLYKCKENDPPPIGHAFLPIQTIFELNRHIQKTHLLTKFHEHWTKNVTSRGEKTAPPPGGQFHDDWAKIVTSRVFTKNTSLPPGGHVFQRTRFIFELNQHIIKTNILRNFEHSRGINGTNVLTKFHENQTINVASKVYARQNVDDTRRTKGDHKSSP